MTATTRFKAQALMNQGLEASARNDTAAACEWFTQSALAEPDWAVPLFLLASEHAANGELELAEAEFANALLVSADFHIARFQLGTLQLSSGRVALAFVTWAPLLTLADDHPLNLFVKGYAALTQDLYSNAIDLFQKGIAVNNENPPLNADIGRIIASINELHEKGDAQDQESSGMAVDAGSSHVFFSNYLART